ncbi:MAG: F0F1 ATP synthase subunit alpha, partial [Ottowia sp.]|nr:F0F1 ATP synthase subunit alpha [Ottowia sp.]
VSQVGDFEKGLLAHLHTNNQDVLDAIQKEQALTDAIKEKLTAAIDAFAKGFA